MKTRLRVLAEYAHAIPPREKNTAPGESVYSTKRKVAATEMNCV